MDGAPPVEAWVSPSDDAASVVLACFSIQTRKLITALEAHLAGYGDVIVIVSVWAFIALGQTLDTLPASEMHLRWGSRAFSEAVCAWRTLEPERGSFVSRQAWRKHVRQLFFMLKRWIGEIAARGLPYRLEWIQDNKRTWLEKIETYSKNEAATTIQNCYKKYTWRKNVLYNPHTAVGKWYLGLKFLVFTRHTGEHRPTP